MIVIVTSWTWGGSVLALRNADFKELSVVIKNIWGIKCCVTKHSIYLSVSVILVVDVKRSTILRRYVSKKYNRSNNFYFRKIMVWSLVCVIFVIYQNNYFVLDMNTISNRFMVSYWYLGLVILPHKSNFTLSTRTIHIYSPIFFKFGKSVYPVLVFLLLPECSQLNAASEIEMTSNLPCCTNTCIIGNKF